MPTSDPEISRLTSELEEAQRTIVQLKSRLDPAKAKPVRRELPEPLSLDGLRELLGDVEATTGVSRKTAFMHPVRFRELLAHYPATPTPTEPKEVEIWGCRFMPDAALTSRHVYFLSWDVEEHLKALKGHTIPIASVEGLTDALGLIRRWIVGLGERVDALSVQPVVCTPKLSPEHLTIASVEGLQAEIAKLWRAVGVQQAHREAEPTQPIVKALHTVQEAKDLGRDAARAAQIDEVAERLGPAAKEEFLRIVSRPHYELIVPHLTALRQLADGAPGLAINEYPVSQWSQAAKAVLQALGQDK